MPCTYASDAAVFDTAGVVQEPEPSDLIENERRLFYVAVTRAKVGVYIGTVALSSGAQSRSGTHRPSRFIDEMQFAPTAAVMGQLQQLASGSELARQGLLSSVERFGGVRRLTKSLIGGYLGDLGDRQLIGRVVRLVAANPEAPFAYRFAYAPPSAATETRSAILQSLHQSWEQVRM